MLARTTVGFIALAALSLVGLMGCSPPPKVLVAHSFAGPQKSTKVMIQDSGQSDPSTKKRLFHVWVRMCDVKGDNSEVNCKDTRILDNVVPGSVY